MTDHNADANKKVSASGHVWPCTASELRAAILGDKN